MLKARILALGGQICFNISLIRLIALMLKARTLALGGQICFDISLIRLIALMLKARILALGGQICFDISLIRLIAWLWNFPGVVFNTKARQNMEEKVEASMQASMCRKPQVLSTLILLLSNISVNWCILYKGFPWHTLEMLGLKLLDKAPRLTVSE